MGTTACSRKLVWLCLALFVLLACTTGQNRKHAQQDAVDSLLISRSDSLYTYPAKMEKCFRDAQRGLTDSAAYYKLELFAGYCLFLQGDFDRAMQTNRTVMDYCNRHPGTDALEAVCWNHRFALLHDMNQRDSVIACLHHAYDAVYRSDDRRELENICINLADQYRQRGDLANASHYYRKGLWVADSLGSRRVKFSLYVGLAQVYADLHNFRLAHHYFDLAEQNPEQRLEYDTYHFFNSKGNCYYFEERYPEALECFRQAYAVCRRFGQPLMDALIEANMGEVHTLLGHTDSAHYYLDKSYAFFTGDVTANEEVIFYLNSLKAALALRENKLSEVARYLSRPYDSLRIGPSYIYLHNKRFMEYYAQKGDFERAYRYRQAVEEYDDSMRNVRNLNNIAEIDLRYSQDTTLLKRDVVIANAEAQLSRQQTTVMLVVTLLIIVVLLAALAFVYIRRKSERKYEKQVALVTRLRMENVANRISPHYTFNVLNTMMPAFKQYPDLSHLLRLFIQVLRGNLIGSGQIAVELGAELELVRNYIALREETNDHAVRTEWDIDPQVPLQTLIPSMGIQIPVENALKYAFADGEPHPDARLLIRVAGTERGVQISVCDNGSGYDPGRHTASERSTGNGLKMIFRTVEVLNGKNTEKMTFDIRNKAASDPDGRGTLVILFVPYNYHFKI